MSNNNALTQSAGVPLILRPALVYTIQNAKDDVGNTETNLAPYLKISDYETDKDTLVSDSELNTTLSDYEIRYKNMFCED